MRQDMSKIHIKEIFPDKYSVIIKVDGVLREESLSILNDVIHRHLGEGRKTFLNLEGLVYITREGREFLKKVQTIIELVNLPPFVGIR